MPHPSGYLDSSGPGVCGEGIPQADRISARIHLMMTMFPEGQELRRRGDPFIPWGFVQAFERSASDFSVMGKEQAGSIGGFPRLPVRIPTGSGGRWERGVFSVGECRGGNRHGGSEAPASERGGISVRGRCAWGIQGVEGAGCPELRGGGSTKAGEPAGRECLGMVFAETSLRKRAFSYRENRSRRFARDPLGALHPLENRRRGLEAPGSDRGGILSPSGSGFWEV